MTVNDMISKYKLELHPDGDKIQMAAAVGKKLSKPELEALKAAKPEIVAELKARKEAEIKAHEEATARLAANVPGLEILRDARAKWDMYYEAQRAAIERGAVKMPQQPTEDTTALAAQYPAAAAYLTAEAYEYTSHYVKSEAGRKAKQAIADGANCSEALAQMEAEWQAHCDEHKWD
jgi:hypothetical protein